MGPRSLPYRPDRPSVAEVAAGAVVWEPAHDSVLLIHEPEEDRWCFPKGHVDPGESLLAAARREVREETGLASLSWRGEVAEVHYRFYQPERERNVLKTAVYFLAVSAEREVRLEATFDRYVWTPVADAARRASLALDRQVMAEALRLLRHG